MCIPVVFKLFVAKRNQLKEVFWAFLRNPACLDRGERCLRETSGGCEQTSCCRTTGGPPILWQHHQAIHPRWSLPHSTTVSTPALALQGCRRQNAYLATFLVSSESLPLICAPAGYFRSDDKTLKRGGAWGWHRSAGACARRDLRPERWRGCGCEWRALSCRVLATVRNRGKRYGRGGNHFCDFHHDVRCVVNTPNRVFLCPVVLTNIGY